MITTDSPMPRISRADAPELAAAEYDRLLRMLRSLSADDWTRPTDCELWDVRMMVAHVVGAAHSCASVREQIHQMRAARRILKQRGTPLVDGLTEVQVRERRTLSPAELIDRFAVLAPKAVRGRERTPGLLRRIDAGDEVIGPMTIGWLMDVIYTRDTWLHRVDIARATGRTLELTADHDGRIVADVVGNWAELHGAPFELRLLGPAGGHFRRGGPASRSETPPILELDAVEFCRILSGRAPGSGLLATRVLF